MRACIIILLLFSHFAFAQVTTQTVDVQSITGTVSLPTGAATSALQTTGNSSLSSIDGLTNNISNATTVPGATQVTGRMMVIGGADGSNFQRLLMDSSGRANAICRAQDGSGNALASYDLDNTGGTSFNLGVSLRQLANGTPVEVGNSTNPLYVALGNGSGVAAMTPGYSSVTTTGTVSAGAYSVAFFNAGTANATVLTVTLGPGERISFTAVPGRTLSAIAWVATGTTLRIAEVR